MSLSNLALANNGLQPGVLLAKGNSTQLSSALRNGAPKSSPFSNHLVAGSLQTESFEFGKTP